MLPVTSSSSLLAPLLCAVLYFLPLLPLPPPTAAYDQETGRARGFAHVEFAEASAVTAAVAKNGTAELDGRTLRVDASAGRGGGGGGGNTPGGRFGNNAAAADGTTIFVKGFDFSGGWMGGAGVGV